MRFTLVFFYLFIFAGIAHSAPRLHVFAAASLSAPLQQISNHFTEETGIETSITFASSSTLARQITQGAPASVFISANTEWMNYIERAQHTETGTRQIILGNRLVIATHKANLIAPFSFPEQAAVKRLGLSPYKRVATGNPQHVPLGLYAQKALEITGLWESWSPFLAPSNSARAALALTERQESFIGIHYASDVTQSTHLKLLTYIPEHFHPPIKYEISLIKTGNLDEAHRYYDYVLSKKAAQVFKNYGFLVSDVYP